MIRSARLSRARMHGKPRASGDDPTTHMTETGARM